MGGGALPYEGVVFRYDLTTRPAACIAMHGADIFRFDETGAAWTVENNPVAIGCPYPEKLIELQARAFLHRNFKALAWLVISFALSTVGVSLLFAMVPELALEKTLHLLRLEMLFNLLMVGAFVIVLLAAFALFFGREVMEAITKPAEQVQGLLGAGLSIAPDIVVYYDGQEAAANWADRVRGQLGNVSPSKWVAVVPFRNQAIEVFTMSANRTEYKQVFGRQSVPFFCPSVKIGGGHLTETYEEYTAFLSAFCAGFPAWAQLERLKDSDRKGSVLADVYAEKTIDLDF